MHKETADFAFYKFWAAGDHVTLFVMHVKHRAGHDSMKQSLVYPGLL